MMHCRRNGASDSGEQEGDAQLEIIGQELVPFMQSPGEFLGAASATRMEMAVVTPQDSLTRPRAGDATRSQENGGEVQLVVANPVLSLGIATPESVQSAPLGVPVSYGPPGQQGVVPDQGDPRVPNGYQDETLLPLFDDQQLRRFAEIYQQAPMVYPSADYVRRPIFLERDGREVEARRGNNQVELEAGRDSVGENVNPNRIPVDPTTVAALVSEVQSLRQAQVDVAKENVALRARLMNFMNQSVQVEEEFNTPDRGEVVSVNDKNSQLLGGLQGRLNECQDPKEFQTPKVLQGFQECLGPQALQGSQECLRVKAQPGPKVPSGPGGGQQHASSSGPAGPSTSAPDQTIQVLMKMMEGMTNLQKQIMDNKDKEKDVETVRSQIELPTLPSWSSTTGPVDLSDWLVLIEPIMADLTATSGEWWSRLIGECQTWYSKHLQLQPLERVAHEPSPSSDLTVTKWVRLERRASTLLLMAIPPDQREELISAKRLTAMKIVCHLMVLYQPGGLAEKELILRQLESPPETTSLSDALQGLRKWSRWRHRATDLGVQEPDPFLLLKGLNRLTRKPLEQHRDLSFRISLARSTLQVDATPTSRTITSFLLHLIAEFEQVVHSEATHPKKKDIPDPKAKMVKPDAVGPKDKGPGGDQGDQRELPPCRFFLTDTGCRKGRGCRFSHDLRDEKRRCYHCGSPEHLAPQCDKGSGGSFKQKASRGQKGQSKGETTLTGQTAEGQTNQGKESMSSILEEANRLLKAMGGSEAAETSSTTGKGGTGNASSGSSDQSREDVMERLQQQLNSLRQKTFRVSLSRMSGNGLKGLIDSGATHPLRPLRCGEDQSSCQKVDVTLADGRKTQLLMNNKGVMLSLSEDIEPILPMGLLQSTLNCKMLWVGAELQVLHPKRGKLPVTTEAGCPMLPRAMTLDLIEEIEDSKCNVFLKSLTIDEEMRWLGQLVNDHPALRDLPKDIKTNLVSKPGQWNDLPYNKRLRKRMRRDGVVVHLYAGPDTGYTLDNSVKKHLGASSEQVGGPRLVEIDVQRGDRHNMLHMNGVYAGLLRCAFDGKLEAILGGPNCRSRSILRHLPIPNSPTAPRPVRAWGGEEFGKNDLTEQEKLMVHQDDTLMMRMVVLYLISNYVKKARGSKQKPWFLLEQPADPYYKNQDVVSWWRTPQWKALKEEFEFVETTFDQLHLGGECNKMTTLGGNIPVAIDRFLIQKKAVKGRVHDSKSLSRWAPKMMDAIATALIQHVLKQEPRLAQLSWQDHIKNGHSPYRRDCKVCQETLQLQRPHRRVKNAISGVLSLDTAGPLELSSDVDGSNAKFLLVGALTWLVHRDVPLKEALPEEPLPDDAPSLNIMSDEEEILAEEEEEETEHASPPNALGNVEDATRDVGVDEAVSVQKEIEEELKDFQLQVFRMTIPMPSKKAPMVLQTAIEMILRLRANGYPIHRVHTDRGREFLGPFKRWMRSRSILVTQTPGADPQGNGRAERAVQSIKQQVRRVLHGAETDTNMWALAARYVNEVLAVQRQGKTVDFPHFLAPVQCRKRYWKTKSLGPTVETVKYLFPAWDSHGHWVLDQNDKPQITRYVMKPIVQPEHEVQWQAVEPEVEDQQAVRRRIRGKTSVRSLEVNPPDDSLDDVKQHQMKCAQVLEEEMIKLPGDDLDLITLEAPVLEKLKKASVVQGAEEEILQTKIIGQDEVKRDWSSWIGAAEEEVNSLLHEKEAFKELDKIQVEELVRKAHNSGQKVEFIPSKLVFTKKPAEKGHRRKVRWVACGNYEAPSEHEQTYSGGADITALRIMVVFAVQSQWSGSTVDVKTAFLNADFDMEPGETVLLVKPPQFFIERGFMAKDKLFLPQKAIYGFRRSPRLWGLCRDRHLAEFVIEVQGMALHLVPLQSEPNLWKIVEKKESDWAEESVLKGLLLTYVDDIFVVAEDGVRKKVLDKIMETWKTSPPDLVGEKPIKFLGMNISKVLDEEIMKEVWYLNQDSYIRDLLEKFKDPPRQIPISRDQAMMEPDPQELITAEKIKLAQQHVGELLWLVTRSRPDLMFAVACMSSHLTKAPGKVSAVASQCRGYLKTDIDGGLRFAPQESSSDFVLEAFSDASFSPDGGPSHGCITVLLNGSAVFWRSGKQQLITLSTAECELVEFVNTVTAGESIYVVLQELTSKVRKVGWCDSRAALGILENEGGNWRTRHLRFRSAYVRQLVLSGEWIACHVPGTNMIADLGTKALSSTKLNQLKKILGMANPPKVRSSEESDGGIESTPSVHGDYAQIKRLVQILSLVASLQQAAGQGDGDLEVPEENGDSKDWIPLVIYTTLVIVVTLIGRTLVVWFLKVTAGDSSPNAIEEKEVSEDEQVSEEDQVQAVSPREKALERPAHLPEPLSDLPHQDPSGHQACSVHQELQVAQVSPQSGQSEGVKAKSETPVGPKGRGGGMSVGVPKHGTGVPKSMAMSMDAVPKRSTLTSSSSSTSEIAGPKLGSMVPVPKSGATTVGSSFGPSGPTIPAAKAGFTVKTTRYGTVYHTNSQCRFLGARGTGASREAQLCSSCRALLESRGDGVPVGGSELKMRAFAQTYHVPNGCNDSTFLETFRCCTSCNVRLEAA